MSVGPDPIHRKDERKLVTILFADLSGFTELSQALDPEDVSDVVNLCFSRLDSIIVAHGGTIDKHEGDLVMALFGVPGAHEDDPERAVRASLDMMGAIPEISRSVSRHISREVNLGLHIGVNVGEVVFTRVGSEHKKDYTVMGDAVNIAARLYSHAETGEIVVSEPVFKVSKHLVDYEVLRPVALKGIEGKVKVFQPIRLKEMPESRRGISGIYSLLVGRDNESNLLKSLIRERGKVVLVSGDAGLGKTRLAAEAREHARDIEWIEGRCLSYGENIAYWPFKEIIKKIHDIHDTDPQDTAREKLLSHLEELFPGHVEEIAPYLGNLCSLKVMEEKVKYLEPEVLKLQTFAAVRSLVNRMGPRNGGATLFVIDDYHWIDDASVELLHFVVEKQAGSSFLLLSRPLDPESEKARLLSSLHRKDFRRIDLTPLDTAAAAMLVRSLLKAPEPLVQLEDAILAKASGNPYYVEEMLKSLMDSGHLVLDSGVWKTGKELDEMLLPQTVQGVIASRIDLLSDDAKNVLQVASVIGRSFHESILKRLCPSDLSLRLANLETLEFIRKEGDTYGFAHPLVHEVAYNSLLKKRRRELHREVGESMEQLFGDRITNIQELLSHHFYAGQAWDKAYDYSYKSANLARTSYDNVEAVELYDRALDCLRNDAEDIELKKKKVVILQEKASVLAHMGEPDRSLDTLDEAISISREIQDKNSEGKGLLEKIDVYRLVSEYDKMAELARATLSFFEELGDEQGRAESLMKIGNSHFYAGRYDDALECYSDSLGMIRQTSRKDMEARLLNNIGAIHTTVGDYSKSLGHTLSALKIAKEIGEKALVTSFLDNIGNIHCRLGNYTDALEYLTSSLGIAREIGYKKAQAKSLLLIGDTYLALGKLEKATDSIESSLRIGKEIASRLTEGWSLLRLSDACHRLGNENVALKHCSDALTVAVQTGNKVVEGAALLGRARIYTEQGETGKALESLRTASETVKKAGARETLVEFEICYAEASLDSGNVKEARSHADRALKISNELKLKPFEAEVLMLLGRMSFAENRLDDMKANFNRALKLLKELSKPFELGRTYYYFGKSLKGDEDGASSGYLSTSESVFERIGAKRWLARVRKENRRNV